MICIGGHFFGTPCILETSEWSKSSTHYLSDKNRFDVSSKGPPDEGLSATYTGHVCTIYNMSGRVVSDIQTRAEGESLCI